MPNTQYVDFSTQNQWIEFFMSNSPTSSLLDQGDPRLGLLCHLNTLASDIACCVLRLEQQRMVADRKLACVPEQVQAGAAHAGLELAVDIEAENLDPDVVYRMGNYAHSATHPRAVAGAEEAHDWRGRIDGIRNLSRD